MKKRPHIGIHSITMNHWLPMKHTVQDNKAEEVVEERTLLMAGRKAASSDQRSTEKVASVPARFFALIISDYILFYFPCACANSVRCYVHFVSYGRKQKDFLL